MINKKILILGGTGALGKSLIERYREKNNIIVYSRNEHKHVDIKRQYKDINSVIGDIRDKDRLISTINITKPDVIIDAAALKHVPICEENIDECVKTNILGHANLIDSVQRSKNLIESLIFISTDKACNPINVYGMSKSISERYFIDFANQQKDTKVIICRYGNVINSTGSVIPFFKKILEEKSGVIPITDFNMTRFLLTLDQSVDLIEWAYKNKETHGCIVVPKLKSIKIVDLAQTLIDYNQKKNFSIEKIGVRPGEKIHEEMISFYESVNTKEYDNYFSITNSKQMLDGQNFSYTSEKNLLRKNEIVNFLKDCKVI